MKTWKPWNDECPYCGCNAEVFTDQDEGTAMDDDDVLCCGCGLPGIIYVDSDDIAHVSWHDGIDCECDWCNSHPSD